MNPEPNIPCPPPVEPEAKRRYSAGVKIFGIFLAMALPVVVLYCFPPEQHPFYPRCLLHSLTGWDCPGCGGLRATHQLLHGNVRQALRLNPFIVVFLPLMAAFILGYVYRTLTGRHVAHPFHHPAWLWILGTAMVLFAVVRNLPAALLAKFGLA